LGKGWPKKNVLTPTKAANKHILADRQTLVSCHVVFGLKVVSPAVLVERSNSFRLWSRVMVCGLVSIGVVFAAAA
jgi:hypothetical protein